MYRNHHHVLMIMIRYSSSYAQVSFSAFDTSRVTIAISRADTVFFEHKFLSFLITDFLNTRGGTKVMPPTFYQKM
jgi:hypothetical protein